MEDIQPGGEPADEMESVKPDGRKRGKRTVLVVVVAVAGLLIIAAAGSLIWLTRGLSTYRKMKIGEVDMTRIADGTYTGRFEGGRWSNTLHVTVEDHRIIDITVVEGIRFNSQEVPNEIFSRVIERQTPAVDTVSGATVTSKAYMKSIENALVEASR